MGDHHPMLTYALAPIAPAAAERLAVPRRAPAVGGVLLTFDDGPHPEGTPAVLEILAGAGAVASFFLIGEQVRRRPDLAARIAAAGHRVGLHGDRHRLQLRLSPREVRQDLARGRATLEEAIGAGVEWHRPPYGIYSPAGLSAVRAAGLRPLLWSRWGKDWRKFTTPSRIAGRVLEAVLPGDVILLHDADFYSARHSHRRTVAALGPVLAGLEDRKLATVLPV
jgi:peptidoglycan/xylan/chitin deacetylase (PgdA/CDA1 family)